MKKNKNVDIKGEIEEIEKVDENNNAIVIRESRLEKIGNIEAVKEQVNNIMQLYRDVMKEGIDYGTVPGTQKPVLLKSGAEKIAFMFRLVSEFSYTEKWLENGHLTIICKCELWTQEKNAKLGEGLGMCSTLEAKYRYRNAERVCPQCGKATIIKGKEEFGGGWICYQKKGGCGAKYKENDIAIVGQNVGKVENENIADVYNTVLKMAKKRAYVDAVLTVSGVSDIFTQDIEEIETPEETQPKSEPTPDIKSNKAKLIEKAKTLLRKGFELETQKTGIKGTPQEYLEFIFGKIASFDLSSKKSLDELTEGELKEVIKIVELEIKELEGKNGI